MSQNLRRRTPNCGKNMSSMSKGLRGLIAVLMLFSGVLMTGLSAYFCITTLGVTTPYTMVMIASLIVVLFSGCELWELYHNDK